MGVNASLSREAVRHLPGQHNQMSHGGKGAANALSARLRNLVPDDQPDDALTVHGGSLDWSDRDGDIRRLEAESGNDGVSVDMTSTNMQQLVSALSVTLLRDAAPPPDADDRQSVLLAALMHAGQRDGVHLADDEIGADRYFDWSTRTDDGSYRVEIGSDGEAVELTMTPEEMAQMHAQLVRTLLADDATRARALNDPVLRELLRYSPEQPRVEAGSASGGQFAADDSGGRKKSNGSETLSYDAKTNRGTGYGVKGGDDRVRGLQEALNRAGLTDANGKPLTVDGKLGPKTTAAIKKAQRQLGVTADGKVTPALLKKIFAMKGAKPAAKTAPRKAPAKAAPKKAQPKAPAKAAPKKTGGRMVARGFLVPQMFDRTFPLDDIQIQRSGDGRTVEAYAAMFGTAYEVRDQFGHYMEVIDRSAFNRTLNGGGRNAMCLYNHGRNLEGQPDSLASIPLGTPLEIRADGRGLLTVTRYNRGPYTDQVLEAIRNGDIKAQSFRGGIYRSDPSGRVPRVRYGQPLPTVTRHELGLTDYGPTPIPVNQGAEIVAVRSVQDVLEYLESLDADERLELLRSLDLDESTPYEDPDEEEDVDEVDEEDDLDDSATSDDSELGAEDPPAERSAVHSGRQADLQRRIRVAMLIRSRK